MKNTVFPMITEQERKLPFYLIGVGCKHVQEHVIRPQGYPNFQWIQCYKGEGELLLDGKYYPVKEQQGMFLYPDEIHEYYAVREPWEVDWITFGGYQVEHFIKNAGFEKTGVFYVANSELVLSKMRKAWSAGQAESSLKGLDCSAIVYELLIDLLKYASRIGDDSVQQQYLKLQPVFNFIEENYWKQISLEEMSKTINITPQHLCLLFKNIMEMRPFEYLNNVRVNKSKDLMIKNHDMEVNEVAKSVGFSNTSYYCSVFKAMEGISPGSFRKLHGL